jgi:hypothetical protein
MRLCYLRGEGSRSEQQIAEELDFRDALGSHSAEAMYEELNAWGLPGWVVYPSGAERRAEGGAERKQKKERKARGTDHVEALPPAARALGLFRWDLERLSYYMGELPGLKEQLQADRFVSSFWVGEDWEYYYRDEYSEKGWQKLCESLGEDPREDVIRVAIDPIKPQGASRTPWIGLVPLIALHTLIRGSFYESEEGSVDGSIDDLLDALHPDATSVDRDKLYGERGLVNELRTSAENLSKILRGGRVRRGHHPGEISDLDHYVALAYITPLAEDGYSDEQIHASLGKEHRVLGKEYTIEDIARLRKLRLPPPDRVPPEDLA